MKTSEPLGEGVGFDDVIVTNADNDVDGGGGEQLKTIPKRRSLPSYHYYKTRYGGLGEFGGNE
eukprot:scaffold10172_cov81-Skeletonema_dohrnii-CCMP3373.AAC.1